MHTPTNCGKLAQLKNKTPQWRLERQTAWEVIDLWTDVKSV